MCWYNIRPARLIQRPTLEWLRPVCVCFHLLQCLLQNYIPDAVQSMLNNNVTQPARIFHKEKIIFIQTTRYWHNADTLAVGLPDIRTSIKTKNSLHSTFGRSTFVHYKFWPLIRISHAEMDSRIQRTNKHFLLSRCHCVSAKRTPDLVRQPYLSSCGSVYLFLQEFFPNSVSPRPPVLAKL